jgi:hypothetical protein
MIKMDINVWGEEVLGHRGAFGGEMPFLGIHPQKQEYYRSKDTDIEILKNKINLSPL